MANNTENEFCNNDSLLRSLNNEKAEHLAPVIAYLAILMLFGIIGNILVCYVYKYRFRAIPSNYFILCLAGLDLLSCCIGVPSEIADLLFPLMYDAPGACKLFRFLNSVTIIGSGATLISVAFDRYYKLCRPLESFPLKKAKILCVIAVSLGVVFAWPALVIFGRKTVKTEIAGLNGCECSVDDSMRDTAFPTLYYGTLILVFTVCLITLAVLYTCMGYHMHKLKNKQIGQPLPKRKIEPPQMECPSSDYSETMNDGQAPAVSMVTNVNTPKQTVQSKVISPGRKRSDRRASRLALTARRTTIIFFVVTLFFILSFLPFLILMIVRALKVVEDMSIAAEVAFSFGVRSYFLNNTSNPIIYGLLNPQFRRECLGVFRRMAATLFFCKRKKTSAY